MKNGLCVILIGPSGVGKTVLRQELLKKIPNSGKLITSTTRSPEGTEVNGVDYHFLTRAEFMSILDRGEFMEWFENYGNWYGSSAIRLQESLEKYSAVFLIIDIRGAREIKKTFPMVVTIYIMPSSMDELRQRLGSAERKRGNLTDRLSEARQEIAQAHTFDHRVINRKDKLEETVEKVISILSLHTKSW